MWLRRNPGLQFALIKETGDENGQKMEIEERIKAAEERSARHLENAARTEIDAYKQKRIHAAAAKSKSALAFQLPLKFDEPAPVVPDSRG